jgi:cobalt-zinc-cadmium efflux system protein
MKTEKNIFIAFFLNLIFAVFEFFGGIFTGSVAIISDAVHDFGDALSIGASYFLEKVSKKQPDKKYTYGYARFSVLGGIITTLILLVGSGVVIYNAILRFINPVEINYNGMLIFAIVGLIVNLLATYFTHGGSSINQKAVNLHMLEDVFGWLVVLIGAIVMRFTNFYIIDPILSILVACFIIFNSLKNLKQILDLFLLKIPKNINLDKITNALLEIDGVKEVHHLHVWTIDGENNYATLHVATEQINAKIKENVKHELKEHGIFHSTVEMETLNENCQEKECRVEHVYHGEHCHHHHRH